MTCMFKYLWGEDIFSHIPKMTVDVRCVSVGETFDFGGDAADDSVCFLVGFLHHTHIPTTGLQQNHT